MKLLFILSLLAVVNLTLGRAADASNKNGETIAILASITGIAQNSAVSGVGKDEIRYDTVALHIIQPAAVSDSYFEIQLPRSDANLELKKKIHHFVLLVVSQRDFELYKKYGLFLVGPSPLPNYFEAKQATEPTPIAVTIPEAQLQGPPKL